MAALGEKNVEMTATVADGWLPLFYVPERAKEVWGDALAKGAANRAADLGPLEVCAGGIVAIGDALRLAQESDLDLVEVAPMARPPVCKLMDYGKFKYESAQKAREARRNQVHTVIKEMKLRPKLDPHDYETKKCHVVRFLKAGDKVKITIMFRGREQHRPELGFRLLQKLAEDVQELGFVESSPKQDGRNMTMVIGPHKKKADAKIDADAARATKAQARADAKAEEDAEREAAHLAGPVAQKKERRRSENLDPEIEA